MDWIKRIGEKEPDRTQPQPEPESAAPPWLQTELQQPEAEPEKSVEIGGSLVPGLTLRRILRGYIAGITRIAWSPDGRRLASPSEDMTIPIWDVERGECLVVLEGHEGVVNSVAWSPDGQRLASGSDDGTVRIWDTDAWETLTVLYHEPIGSLAWSPDGQSWVADYDEAFDTFIIDILAWSPDGQRLASGSDDGIVRIWDTDAWETLTALEHENSNNSVAWSPDGQRLASGADATTVHIWDPISSTVVQVLEGHSDLVLSVAWAPNRPLLASGGYDNTIRVWDVESGIGTHVLEGHTEAIHGLAFSADGCVLASKSRDNSVRLWNTDTWETVAVWTEEVGTYSGPAFHPHLPRLATMADERTVLRVWDLDMDVLLGSQAATEAVRYTTAKLVLVGDSGVGKTGLGWRLAHDEFKEHASTHGQQFWVIDELGITQEDGTECEAVLWDLAGQHVYRPIHAIFLDDVNLSLVLFDPANRQEPLKGVEFWLEQLSGKQELPPTVLVGARVDRGAPVLSQQEFDQFCQRHGISGGYISTSAMTGVGLDKLLETLKIQIPWDQMTATVTTVTFKRIKEYVLSLKEKPDRQGVLVHSTELRRQLQAVDPEWQFTDAEMMTAVKHLENHGYVTVLRSSSGEEFILLIPELLVDLASSIVLQADKHPRELGALSETLLLHGGYPFQELVDLVQAERQILLDAAVVRFLSHNICFRETLGTENLLIFPGLIKQKRPLLDEFEPLEDVSYIVRGRVENIYPALVVLLGYTPTFTRVNQWQNQAQYEMGEGEICGFRLVEEREGEIELVLYYSATMPDYGRTMFQGLFEKFLYQRDVEVTRFPPVVCSNNHRQERATVVKRVREGKGFLFCEECGEKIALPEIEKPRALGVKDARWTQREEALVRLRSTYETHLVRVKGFRRDRALPRCYISHTPEQVSWVSQLADDLRDAGVHVLEDSAQVQADDFVILVGTPAYKQAWNRSAESIAADTDLIQARLHQAATQWPTIVPLLREGDSGVATIPSELRDCLAGDFRDETHYAVSLFDLVLTLYAIPLNHPAFKPLREALQKEWEERLGKMEKVDAEPLPRTVAPTEATPPDGASRQIFISYAWGDESEAIANELDRAFQARGVTIVRDKRELGFKGRIKAFMESIGRGKCVILVISEKYLKSENCLFELLQVAKHGYFAERIFPIVLDDAGIYRPVDRIRYVRYWENQLEKLDKAMKTVSAANMQGFREDIDLYTEIRAHLPRLADLLRDMNALTPETHRGSDFAELFEAVMAKLSD